MQCVSRAALAAILSVALAACQSGGLKGSSSTIKGLGDDGGVLGDGSPDIVDIIPYLDPSGRGRSNNCEASDKLQCALRAFYQEVRNPPQKLVRNQIQERLIAASNYNCSQFKRSLFFTQSAANFWLGSLITGLAGAASLVSPESTAQAMAGGAAVFSGVRAELNANFFRDKVAELITRAIDRQRDTELTAIRSKQNAEISAYNVEAALADVVSYNDTCSLITGLQLVGDAVTIAADPVGLRRMDSSLRAAGLQGDFSLSVQGKPGRGDAFAAKAITETTPLESLQRAKLVAPQILAAKTRGYEAVGEEILKAPRSDNVKTSMEKELKTYSDNADLIISKYEARTTVLITEITENIKTYSDQQVLNAGPDASTPERVASMAGLAARAALNAQAVEELGVKASAEIDSAARGAKGKIQGLADAAVRAAEGEGTDGAAANPEAPEDVELEPAPPPEPPREQ